MPAASCHQTTRLGLIDAIDAADTLMVGDGLNDARAFDAAFCAGTPALDSPVMPSRADFFFRAGSGAVAGVLDTAVLLRRVVWHALSLGVAYNAGALALTLTGHMTPLLCAIVMPASSLLLLAYTGWRMRPGMASWT